MRRLFLNQKKQKKKNSLLLVKRFGGSGRNITLDFFWENDRVIHKVDPRFLLLWGCGVGESWGPLLLRNNKYK